MTPVKAERILQVIEAFARRFIPAIGDPAIGLKQYGRPQKTLVIPPVGRASRGAAETQDTGGGAVTVLAVEEFGILRALQALARGRRRVRLEPWLYRLILRNDMGLIGHQILDHVHMRQGRDLDFALHLVNRLQAGQRILAVDIHGAGAANSLPAGSAEGQRAVHPVLDMDQRIQHHRPAFVQIDFETVPARIVIIIRRPAINTQDAVVLRLGRRRVVLAGIDPGMPGECQLDHDVEEQVVYYILLYAAGSVARLSAYVKARNQKGGDLVMQSITVNDIAVPALGFGTWQMTGDECRRAVEYAIACGYRHIDTAQVYNNERDVGEALNNTSTPRDRLFVTTKAWRDRLHDGDLQASLDESLQRLQCDYVDLLLVHWPVDDVPFDETMRALEDVRQKGKSRLIGVSNFTVAQMRQCVENLGANLATNQVEYHPYIDQTPVLDYLRGHNMVLTAYAPLARGQVLRDPVITESAEKYGKTPGQVTLRWLIEQEGVIAIPKAASKAHIEANLDIVDFQLDAADTNAINTLAREDGRLINPGFAPEWDTASGTA